MFIGYKIKHEGFSEYSSRGKFIKTTPGKNIKKDSADS